MNTATRPPNSGDPVNDLPAIVLKRFLLLMIAVLAVGLAGASASSASLPVGPGSTFSTSYVDLAEGVIPGGDSGYFGSGANRSSLSSDGRYLAFTSDANSMSADANPDYTNIFRKDRQTGAVELVSRASGASGAAPAAYSFEPRISGDGNLVAFLTGAALDPADTDGDKIDVYVRDLSTDATTLATPGTVDSVVHFDLSANGVFVAFETGEGVLPAVDANAFSDIYRRNLLKIGRASCRERV